MNDNNGGYKIDAAIVGAADLVSPTGSLGISGREAEVRALNAALEDAGLKLHDVDALYCVEGAIPGLDLAEYLGIRPRITDSSMTGGSAFEVLVQHAAMALTLGECDVAAIVFGETPRYQSPTGNFIRDRYRGLSNEVLEWELPYGGGVPLTAYALATQRHMHEYGTTQEQLAEIAVSTRQWATMNPVARYQEPITVDDVVTSPMVANPLKRLDCCLFTDGAGAVILTRRDRAKDLTSSPVYVIGAGSSQSHSMSISQMPDLTVTPGSVSSASALQQAKLILDDIDVLQVYDSFTITVLLALEDIGFCDKGEGGSFVTGGRLGPGGSLPTNTSGGGLSYTHPGMFGMFLLVEAARQLQGKAGERQVDGCKVAMAHGCGGLLSSTSTIIMTNEEAL